MASTPSQALTVCANTTSASEYPVEVHSLEARIGPPKFVTNNLVQSVLQLQSQSPYAHCHIKCDDQILRDGGLTDYRLLFLVDASLLQSYVSLELQLGGSIKVRLRLLTYLNDAQTDLSRRPLKFTSRAYDKLNQYVDYAGPISFSDQIYEVEHEPLAGHDLEQELTYNQPHSTIFSFKAKDAVKFNYSKLVEAANSPVLTLAAKRAAFQFQTIINRLPSDVAPKIFVSCDRAKDLLPTYARFMASSPPLRSYSPWLRPSGDTLPMIDFKAKHAELKSDYVVAAMGYRGVGFYEKPLQDLCRHVNIMSLPAVLQLKKLEALD